jgi:hypothetical protein
VYGVKKQRVSDIRKQSQIIRNVRYSTLCKRQTKGNHEARKIINLEDTPKKFYVQQLFVVGKQEVYV